MEDDLEVELEEEEGEKWCVHPFFDLLFFDFFVVRHLRLWALM